MEDQIMDAETRARALQLLGGGAAAQAGQQVSAPNRMAQLAAQEQAAMGGAPIQPPPQQMTPQGGPVQPSPYGGPVAPAASQQADPGFIEKMKRIAQMLRGR